MVPAITTSFAQLEGTVASDSPKVNAATQHFSPLEATNFRSAPSGLDRLAAISLGHRAVSGGAGRAATTIRAS
jgi:hypothetical protein